MRDRAGFKCMLREIELVRISRKQRSVFPNFQQHIVCLNDQVVDCVCFSSAQTGVARNSRRECAEKELPSHGAVNVVALTTESVAVNTVKQTKFQLESGLPRL